VSEKILGAYNIEDLRTIAQRRVPKGVFEFMDRGSEDEIALHNNRSAFERIKLNPRTLMDVSKRTQSTTLFGKPMQMPIAIAPTGIAGLMWYQGELELARAAAAAGIPFTLATGGRAPVVPTVYVARPFHVAQTGGTCTAGRL
jgi:(S)-mandelate dehydrogenase